MCRSGFYQNKASTVHPRPGTYVPVQCIQAYIQALLTQLEHAQGINTLGPRISRVKPLVTVILNLKQNSRDHAEILNVFYGENNIYKGFAIIYIRIVVSE